MDTRQKGESRWPVALAIFAAGVIPLALPRALTFAPAWILVPANVILLGGAKVAYRLERHKLNEQLGYAVLGLLTLELLYSLITLVLALPGHTEPALKLLESAFLLWVSNVIVYAAWYWRLDAGGPYAREGRRAHLEGAFLFPQMSVDAPGKKGVSIAEAEGWSPGFVDYFAISFYTATAFSPTDVLVFSRWAKAMMMTQAGIAFGTVLLLAARAVNIL